MTIAGLITGLQVKRTKKGDLWAIATVEDLAGSIECLFFPSTYMTVSTMLTQDAVCVVKGRVNKRDETVALNAMDLTLPEINDGPQGPVVLHLQERQVTETLACQLRAVLEQHPGTVDVHIRLRQPSRTLTVALDTMLRVSKTTELQADLKALLGSSAVGA